MCSSILSALGPSWVGSIIPEVTGIIFRFRLLWKAVDLLCKLLCKGAGLGTVRCLVHLATFSLMFCLGGAVCSFLLRQNSNCEGLLRPSQFEIRYSCHYGMVFYYTYPLLYYMIWNIVLYYVMSYGTMSYHIILCSLILFNMLAYCITSYVIISYVLCCIISYVIIS